MENDNLFWESGAENSNRFVRLIAEKAAAERKGCWRATDHGVWILARGVAHRQVRVEHDAEPLRRCPRPVRRGLAGVHAARHTSGGPADLIEDQQHLLLLSQDGLERSLDPPHLLL